MKVTILSHTPKPEKVIAAAARLCYSKISASDLMDNFDHKEAVSFIKKLMDMGHMSPMEHVSFTFAIDGVSRTLLAQITRHRIASFSVQSLRYNNPFDRQESQETDKMIIRRMSYLEGFEYSRKLLGEKNSTHAHNIKKYQIKGRKPNDLVKLHRSSYILGIFDSVGCVFEKQGLYVAFPSELKPIFKNVSFNITERGNELLITSKDLLDFAHYVYEDMDFANFFYDEKKFLALCNGNNLLKNQVSLILQNFIQDNYYATVPISISKNLRAMLLYIKSFNICKQCYTDLVKLGIDQEDARYILPNGIQTKMVLTMNVRSLYNFFNLRCCERAQTEIRQLAYLMLNEVKKVAPNLFENAGAPCKKLGYCPEGSYGCGKYPPLK